nr:MAG TPA_asm: hypothetical protein [Caudoviricetes sp.]
MHNYALLLIRETSKLFTIYLTKIYLPYLYMYKYSCLTY